MPKATSRNHYKRQKRSYPNLEQRRHRWYAVLAVPKELQLRLGRKGKRK